MQLSHHHTLLMIAVLCSLSALDIAALVEELLADRLSQASRVFGAPIETAISTAHVDPVPTASAGEVRSVTLDGCRLYYCI
ncbi:unnamed protein product [Mycena citricolor]|uniref:Secreted protein n=1 Tax=Mycena citricolor TaxID=2018698 RepID=A0AAD2K7I3_9AGAR|nr:unnamed protein product [Mycena citricolor]CAK5283511.1 unnamed protein product [Mycena citricolor]